MPPLTIEYAVAQTEPISDQIWFTTTTEPIHSAIIEPRVNGFLTEMTHKSGELVSQGELLYRIDPDQLKTLYLESVASMESAEASFVEARNNYDRAVPMAQINAISRSSLDEYRAKYIAAKASVASAQQQMRNAEINLSYTTIKSPIDGVIAYSTVSIGDYIGPGTKYTTLTTIKDIDTVQMALSIPTATYLKHATSTDSGDNAALLSNIELILADNSVYPLMADYSYTKQDASQNSSAISIVVNLPNPDQQLKSGMFARVKANIGVAQPRVLIPQQAVTQLQGVSSVWIISSDSTARMQMVSLGAAQGDMWVVRSGVKAGDKVALTGQLKLHNGAKVDPMRAAALQKK